VRLGQQLEEGTQRPAGSARCARGALFARRKRAVELQQRSAGVGRSGLAVIWHQGARGLHAEAVFLDDGRWLEPPTARLRGEGPDASLLAHTAGHRAGVPLTPVSHHTGHFFIHRLLPHAATGGDASLKLIQGAIHIWHLPRGGLDPLRGNKLVRHCPRRLNPGVCQGQLPQELVLVAYCSLSVCAVHHNRWKRIWRLLLLAPYWQVGPDHVTRRKGGAVFQREELDLNGRALHLLHHRRGQRAAARLRQQAGLAVVRRDQISWSPR